MNFPVKSIGIIGNGVVGNATAQVYKPFYVVRVYDSNPIRRIHPLNQVLDTDIVFLCIPETELDPLFNLNIGLYKDVNFVIRSTCPIGTTRRLKEKYGIANICHSPEFLTERTAVIDALTPTQVIIGSTCYRRGGSIGSDPCGSMLWGMYDARFPGVPKRCMDTDESEAIKLMLNAFFATKVSFFNEMNDICKGHGLDWQTVLDGMLGDGRIAHSHTQVPGPDGKFGFGGKCLPKDLNTLISCAVEAIGDRAGNVRFPLVTQSVRARNVLDRKRISDE